jgi:hypothetical protein
VYTRDSIAPRQADSSNVYENTLDLGFEFSRQDLSGGEGLDFFPRPFNRQEQELDATRFYRSMNLELRRPLPGEEYLTRLALNADTWGSTAAVGAPVHAIGGHVAMYWFFNDTTQVTHSRAVNASTGLGVSTQLAGGTSTQREIVMAAIRGIDTCAFLRRDFEIRVRLHDDGPTDFVAVPNGAGETDDIRGLWGVKDRFIVWRRDAALSGPGTLEEMDLGESGAAGSPTFAATFVTIDSMEAPVLHVGDGGTAILACTADGYIRSYVPAQQSADASDIFLELRGRTRMPDGEIPIATHELQGTVLILTEQSTDTADEATYRLYRAELLDERFDFVLGQLQLLRTWMDVKEMDGTIGDKVSEAPHVWTFQSTRDTIQFRIYSDEPVGFFEETTDQYVYDVVTTGLHRYVQDLNANDLSGTSGVRSFLLWRDYEWWLPDDLLLETRIRRTSLIDNTEEYTKASTDKGWLITPMINFGVNAELNWIEVNLQGQNFVNTGDRIEVFVSTDADALNDVEHSSWQSVAVLQSDTDGDREFPLDGIRSHQLTMKVELTAGLETSSPELIRFGIRAFPGQRDFIAEIPVNISDYIDVPGRMPVHLPGWGDEVHRHLMNQSGQGMDLEVFDPPVTIRGIVDVIAAPVTYVAERGSAGRYCTVRFRGNRIADQTIVVGVAHELDTGQGATVA